MAVAGVFFWGTWPGVASIVVSELYFHRLNAHARTHTHTHTHTHKHTAHLVIIEPVHQDELVRLRQLA